MNRIPAFALVTGLIAVGALGVACGKDDSLGNDRDDSLPAAGSGGRETSTGGAKAQTGGSGNQGGSESEGGSKAMGGAEEPGGAPSEAGSGGDGANNGTGGNAGSGSGGAPPGTGGTTEAGGAPDDVGGSGGASEPGDVVTTPSEVGTGACADTSVGDVLEQIAALKPELATSALTSLNSFRIGGGTIATRSGDGFRVVISVGAGDCQAGCIDREYWYFETNADCSAVEVGHYARLTGGGGGCIELGAPLWGLPEPVAASSCESLDLDDLNTNCVNDACPSNLEPVHFYGVAGMSGPLFCMCVITCEEQVDSGLCPEGTRCQYIADGPGDVCWKF